MITIFNFIEFIYEQEFKKIKKMYKLQSIK